MMVKVFSGGLTTCSLVSHAVKLSIRGLALGLSSDMKPVPTSTLAAAVALGLHVAAGPNPVSTAAASLYGSSPFSYSQVKLKWLANMRPPLFTYDRTLPPDASASLKPLS